jgi:hypothetical protein
MQQQTSAGADPIGDEWTDEDTSKEARGDEFMLGATPEIALPKHGSRRLERQRWADLVE